MKNIYVLVKFQLKEWVDISEWKTVSDGITEKIEKEEGCFFRDSAVDEAGNVYCIIKWESEEKQKAFKKKFHAEMKEKPEIMKEFSRIGDMDTMTMDILEVL